MTGGLESLGDAVTGGVLARAVQPQAGEAAAQGDGTCPNCGSALTGAYCAACGQKGHVHRTLGAFWHDLVHGVFHFEGKIWRTLPLLAWRPGELTRRYVEGERARFVSPIALFLFSVFLMFATFSALGGPFPTDSGGHGNEINLGTGDAGDTMEALQDELRGLQQERREAVEEGDPTASIDARIASLQRAMAILRPATPAARPADPPQNAFERAYRRAKENPSLLIYKLETNAYKFSWALIPISVPFVWLLFLWRRRYKAFDHTVFVTYSIAFMTLLMVALSLVRPIFNSTALPVLALTFVPPIHMYRQLRGAYQLKRFSALWRTFFLLFFATIAATLFFLLLLTLGVMGE